MKRTYLIAVVTLVLALVANSGAYTSTGWEGTDRLPRSARAEVPEDRYAMAGGCYTLRAPDGGYVARAGSGFAADGTSSTAEPFWFQATELGQYLFYASKTDFLAASEGLAGEAVYAATKSLPGQIAGGVTIENTDKLADEIARGPVNEATGRGASVVAAKAPSELADWKATQDGTGTFLFTLPATKQGLAVAGSSLVMRAAKDATPFALQLTEGCATYPEVEVNVDGPLLGGVTEFQEARGYLEAHLHMMAFEFIGGRVRCGRPWHRYGVAHALVDCPDHTANGAGAVLEQALSGAGTHTPDGWPSFTGWPRHNSLTHEQIYYKWLERAWRGGLRMFVNLLVDNRQLCQVYPFKRNSCNEMDGVRLQAQRIRELENYIDAQSGGPGEGWFRIVTDPFQARAVINQGKLAVVLGIEVSVPLDCGITLDIPACDVAQIEKGLDEVYALGVRQMELVNKFDNAFSGITGDAGNTGIVVNQGNKGETGHYWRMKTCDEGVGDAHDHTQANVHDQAGTPDEFTGRDSMVGGILAIFGQSGVAPIYPEGPHCNVLGLSTLGETMIRGMVKRGMIFDPDHMSARARTEAMDLIEEIGHSGVVSSHGWADDTIYPRVYEAGGVVTPHAGSSTSFLAKWRKHRAWADPRFYFGLGFGADTNGFSNQGGPRGANAPNKVTYPFTAFGGSIVQQQKSGTRTYNINTDGVSHYGLYPDWIEDVRRLAGADGATFINDMERGPEAYLQMWERSIGIAPDACRADVADLSDASVGGVSSEMTVRDVLMRLGQPAARGADEFRFCMSGNRSAKVRFTMAGRVREVVVS